jgi:hypothetical protein
VTAVSAWESWAPPLSPPSEGGLDYDVAASIAAAWWECEPHLAAALMWESYAATLPPELPVSMVTTGSQSVAYGRAVPTGELGAAMAQAEWHRSFVAVASVPLRVGR